MHLSSNTFPTITNFPTSGLRAKVMLGFFHWQGSLASTWKKRSNMKGNMASTWPHCWWSNVWTLSGSMASQRKGSSACLGKPIWWKSSRTPLTLEKSPCLTGEPVLLIYVFICSGLATSCVPVAVLSQRTVGHWEGPSTENNGIGQMSDCSWEVSDYHDLLLFLWWLYILFSR